MNGYDNERIYRTRREIMAEIEDWERKIGHAQERQRELNGKWDKIPAHKRALLGEFLERLEQDIAYMENMMALCECELQGMEG